MAKKKLEINSIEENEESRFSRVFKIDIKALIKKIRGFDTKQKAIYLGIIGGVFLSLLALVVLWMIFHKKTHEKETQESREKVVVLEKKQDSDEEIPSEVLQSLPKLNALANPINNKELNGLIQKAHMLYSNGNVSEALNVYNKIATFSQSLANYNLGVVRLKQKEYAMALKSFKQAISSGDDISLNAFNAAMSAKYLNDQSSYKYYLNLAAKELSQENSEAFYSYLYALIQFYNQNYFATFSALKNPNSDAYVQFSDALLVKTYLIFNNYENAIDILEKKSQKDYKTLGLLYAKIGDYDRARQYLSQYAYKYPDDRDAKLALQIVYLKMKDFFNAAKILEQFTDKNEQEEVLKSYPIKVVLHPKIFDINLGQELFVKHILDAQDVMAYKILFYYAPFKVFNIQDALGALHQGGMLLSGNVLASEEKVLEGQTIAKIDKSIVEALIYVNQKKVRKALGILKTMLDQNPNHSILHYNAGLLYAQMENYTQAYKHFTKAYYLNTQEIDSAMYAIITSYFLDKNTKRIQNDITKNFEDLVIQNPEHRKFLLAFLGYLNNNVADEMLWIEQVKNKKSIYYALKAAYAMRSKNQKALKDSFMALKDINPNDFVADIFYMVARDLKTNFKQISLGLHNLLVQKVNNFDSIFYGPALARELYAHIGFITGSLQNQEETLRKKLTETLEDANGILQALALVNIYQHKFEQAYDIYKVLIEKLKEDDSRTQFLAAVAAMGLQDKDNATLLLQLSKMEAESEFEARMALGMLYQQRGDFRTATRYYNMLSGKTFEPQFFDFEIDIQKILDSRRHKK
ncbi:tetratricopeptide repeat protein [Helicobacter sp. faydin-H20]|uniref:tetratricopeptide repeat protein n=1 Tax=Helicobacter anatolicus TaxID=2905874 RepID=UPI001E48AF74|nr:tetratricopeptide repeat protein [Helicobacter anatolicus]MCE3037305.1 tetratricopeptide repeat protein [Helicobacter anatolicus]